MSSIVHVVGGTGTGEALVALLADFSRDLGISEVTFHRRAIAESDRPHLRALLDKGATLCADETARATLSSLGLSQGPLPRHALERASVVIDCTAQAVAEKGATYSLLTGAPGLIATTHDRSFGSGIVWGVNSHRVGGRQFLRIPSAGAHAIAVLCQALGGGRPVDDARFLLLRRSHDLAVGVDLPASPIVERHDDDEHGCTDGRDAHEALKEAGLAAPLFASAVEVNAQLMHAVHFAVRVAEPIDVDEALRRVAGAPRVALTDKRSANPISAFARDFGYLGRSFNVLVVPRPSLVVRGGREVVGTAFVPEEGAVLYSTVAAALAMLDPESAPRRLDALKPYIFEEV